MTATNVLRFLMAILLSLWLLPVHAEEAVTGTVAEERVNQPQEENRDGLVMVKRMLTLGNMAIRYQQVIDPKQADAVVNQRYGDYILGCDFPRWTWNWDLQYFIDVTVTRPGQPPFIANRVNLQRGMYVLEQGERGVADMVWPLPERGELVIRLIKAVEEEKWVYLQASVEGDPEAKITTVKMGSYPVITTGPPERQRWVTSATRGVQMTDAAATLNPAEEWSLALHNKFAQEDGGALLVFDPSEITTAQANGTYNVLVHLNTQPVQTVHLAMGYFWDKPWEQAVPEFQQKAAERLKRLRAMDWAVPMDVKAWEREKTEVEELLGLSPEARTQYGEQWTKLQAAAQAAGQRQGEPGTARELILLTRQARELKAALYEPALNVLIEAAVK